MNRSVIKVFDIGQQHWRGHHRAIALPGSTFLAAAKRLRSRSLLEREANVRPLGNSAREQILMRRQDRPAVPTVAGRRHAPGYTKPRYQLDR